jgi:hypothetical protein
MVKRGALPFVLAAVLASASGARGGGTADPPPDPAPDAGTADPDQEIVDHLDEIVNLELLQNLELFDPKADGAR